MIQTHDTFVCRPGNASKLAKLCKEHMPFDPQKGPYVLTDMTGQFHRVILIMNYANLAAYEEEMKKRDEDTPENKKMMETFKNMNEMYISGSREIFRVW